MNVRDIATRRAIDRAKAELLDELSSEWCAAIQADLENGVASLNEAAAQRFKRHYPSILSFGSKLCDRAVEAMAEFHDSP
jgi:hypothetical protein